MVKTEKATLKKCTLLLVQKQGQIHGQYQLRTGGQERKCVLSHFSTRAHGPTDGLTD